MGVLASHMAEDSVDGGKTMNIGLIEKSGSGKTTAAKQLVEKFGYFRMIVQRYKHAFNQ